MTAHQMAGASSAAQNWHSINWDTVEFAVRRLQVRIAKATREGRWGKAKALQHLLTHSRSAKLLAVKRVTENKGKNTPGVDGVIWKTAREKWMVATALKRRGYKAKPLRRLYIPKKNGNQRPLGIPTMSDRAMQALYLLALMPVSETLADYHSYGFRPQRCCQDAIGQVFIRLRGSSSGKWILEGDIKACFDNISHEWLLRYIPMDKRVLKEWLIAGYMEGGTIYETTAGTPQGGVASPTIANMALDGMAAVINKVIGNRDRVQLIRYADDFIVTATDKATLEQVVKPAIEVFLKERGLSLSQEKTRITHVEDGFDFLGFNIRRYNGKLLIKPAKSSVKSILSKVKEVIMSHIHVNVEVLIALLNPIIRGWCNYHRYVVAKETFSYIGHRIFQMIIKWVKRRHPNKSAKWWTKKYFIQHGLRNWVFATVRCKGDGTKSMVKLYQANDTPIVRHIKVRAGANPFDPEYLAYFEQRNQRPKFRPNEVVAGSVNGLIKA